MVVRATFEPSRVASSDRDSSLTLQLHNESDADEQVRLKPVGKLAPHTVLHSNAVRLTANEHLDLPVVVRTDRELQAGAHVCAVEVASQGEHTTAEATLDVEEHAACAITLQPERSASGNIGRHRLRIDNKGNVPVRVDAFASAATRADLRAEPDPDVELPPSAVVELMASGVTVQPGQTIRNEVRVRPYERFWSGSSRLHDYEITAIASSGESYRLDGQFEQLPRVRPWLAGAVVGALLALLLGTLAWFTLLRPAVEDIATEAAADAAEVNRAIIANALNELEQAAAEAAELPLGQPVDVRLSVDPTVGTSGVDSDAVEAGRTVSVTDLVFQNPTGAVGSVELRRGGETLLRSDLANFRDLDFHFVSALQFEGPTTIELIVECVTPGPGQETCPVGATITGFIDET